MLNSCSSPHKPRQLIVLCYIPTLVPHLKLYLSRDIGGEGSLDWHQITTNCFIFQAGFLGEKWKMLCILTTKKCTGKLHRDVHFTCMVIDPKNLSSNLSMPVKFDLHHARMRKIKADRRICSLPERKHTNTYIQLLHYSLLQLNSQ